MLKNNAKNDGKIMQQNTLMSTNFQNWLRNFSLKSNVLEVNVLHITFDPFPPSRKSAKDEEGEREAQVQLALKLLLCSEH